MRGPVICASLLCLGASLALYAQQFEEDRDTPARRQEYFRHIRAYPLESVPAEARLKAIQQLERMRAAESKRAMSPDAAIAASPLRWTPIGPQPAGFWGVSAGRITALAVSRQDANMVYAGAADGGVWLTTDGGRNWTPLTDSQVSLSIGSMAIDPNNADVLYVGTGEANNNWDGYAGAGILKTTDRGHTWKNIPGPFAGGSIGALVLHPNGKVLLAAANGGVYRSGDAGDTWQKVLNADVATAVVFDPFNPQVAYAGIAPWYSTSPSGLYKSGDAGVTWTALKGNAAHGLPSGGNGAHRYCRLTARACTRPGRVLPQRGRVGMLFQR